MALDGLRALGNFLLCPADFTHLLNVMMTPHWGVVSIKSNNGYYFVHPSAPELFHTTAVLFFTLFPLWTHQASGNKVLFHNAHCPAPAPCPSSPPKWNFAKPLSPSRLTSPHWSWGNIYPWYAGAAWINAQVKGSPSPSIFQQSTSHMYFGGRVHIPPLPAQTL